MKVLIIDDECLARTELRRLLRAHPEVRVVGDAADAESARARIAELRPDLLLLDIQMPGESGFDLLAGLVAVPHVVFTTAYDEFAVRAFEVNALDYLLKPIEPERLAAAIAKVSAVRKLAERAPASNEAPPRSSVDEMGVAADRLSAAERVFVRDGENCWFVRLGVVLLFEADGHCTVLHGAVARTEPARRTPRHVPDSWAADTPRVHRPLNHLEARLDPAFFFRANRQQIVNLRFVRSIHPWFKGQLMLRLEGGREVVLSRRRAQRSRELRSL